MDQSNGATLTKLRRTVLPSLGRQSNSSTWRRCRRWQSVSIGLTRRGISHRLWGQLIGLLPLLPSNRLTRAKMLRITSGRKRLIRELAQGLACLFASTFQKAHDAGTAGTLFSTKRQHATPSWPFRYRFQILRASS